uniref:Uncharacterized protein n=1 Tax=Sipha flava TaxID=143950 RepID=A0A2S2QFN2_9HEMI
MSSDTENHDHNTGTEDKIYDDLEKLIDSVDAEERELKKRMEKKNLNGVEKEANGCLAASKNEEFEHKSTINELEDESIKIKTENADKKSEEDNSHYDFKDSQNNSEDGKEELELSEMIVCDEVAGDSDEVCILLIKCMFVDLVNVYWLTLLPISRVINTLNSSLTLSLFFMGHR